MLKPSMKELMNKVGNRYLLVNLAAQRARDIAQEAEEKDEQLPDKAVKLALDEIAAGTIVYCPGPKVEPEYRLTSDLLPGMLDLDDHEDADVHEDHVEDDTADEDTLDDDTDEDA
ncbi:DNA-directed RNA polymerase subunit omega [Butyricicoccus pullicaecorum]|uniref:DNA-directed RNA polymerase subunit omega n=2 Tax=Butyricicoccus pullicaecorum TaxID=501571 RepID=R8W487_9FIRM|nr:DNA-directed RNA polymerase subunit omega [Butyricicoccus pullicaecorum]EOQ39760.1 DNA-directed RNA polymerase, omega subunit [Butyricicoccus pullicaecorum 1.2]OUP53774.1 DNA-directed RNA polymerase subunit omega [Butyricicoccus pullicaecorum]OUP60763.1 DNA-directed RNA polymerase subunit omega [Butyricicoccus pullicaecorum]SKA57209.1 DNA-directed RNA polymerase, omega subunit [Butyricicoccus pullicaecorum DSM 23266]HJF52560.1 DNA-directed RNA polymerase subunit omega [Butyricicoccus pullic